MSDVSQMYLKCGVLSTWGVYLVTHKAQVFRWDTLSILRGYEVLA